MSDIKIPTEPIYLGTHVSPQHVTEAAKHLAVFAQMHENGDAAQAREVANAAKHVARLAALCASGRTYPGRLPKPARG
jgi:hypothetical protein